MKELLNVAILLCEDCDEKKMNFHNIFDKISLNGERASFCIATIINAVEYTKEKFSLHLFLLNLEENKQIYIGEIDFEHERALSDESGSLRSSVKGTFQKMSIFELDNVQFLSGGNHEILVYLCEDQEVEEARDCVEKEIPYDIQNHKKLVATYGFEVCLKNK